VTLARSALLAGLGLALLLVAVDDAGSAEQNPGGFLALRRGCEIETHPLAFGNYDPLTGRAVDALGSLRYRCMRVGRPETTALRDVRIEMSRGASNSYDRQMFSGADQLRYNVYLDATHTTVWGDGSSNTDYYLDRHPPNNSPVTVPIYGHIFPLQDVAAGNYVDVLEVTILF